MPDHTIRQQGNDFQGISQLQAFKFFMGIKAVRANVTNRDINIITQQLAVLHLIIGTFFAAIFHRRQ